MGRDEEKMGKRRQVSDFKFGYDERKSVKIW
jgi:hypothetical protein